MNTTTVFDILPALFPTFPNNEQIISESADIFKRAFSGQAIKQMCVYPTDIYNVYDDENIKVTKTIIAIALAGFEKDDINVEVSADTLFVTINKKEDKECKPVIKYVQNGISYRNAKIAWTISKNVDKSKINVSFINGILSITLPMLAEKKEQQNIKLTIND